MKLRIFTDGACSGNPGPGGWAALFTYPESNRIISGNEESTTNNRMELMAVVRALSEVLDEDWTSCVRPIDSYDDIEIHSDSAYVVNAVSKGWLKVWQTNGWKTSTREAVKNSELWEQLIQIMKGVEECGATIKFVKVKGHNGNLFNEMVDERARSESIIAKKKVEAK